MRANTVVRSKTCGAGGRDPDPPRTCFTRIITAERLVVDACDEGAAATAETAAYLWQIVGEVVTEGSEGLAAKSHVVVGAVLVKTLLGGVQIVRKKYI